MILFPLTRQSSCCYTGFHLILIKLYEITVARNTSTAFIKTPEIPSRWQLPTAQLGLILCECQQPGLGCSLSYKCGSHIGLQQYYSFSCQWNLIPSLQVSLSHDPEPHGSLRNLYFSGSLAKFYMAGKIFAFFFKPHVVWTLFQLNQQK